VTQLAMATSGISLQFLHIVRQKLTPMFCYNFCNYEFCSLIFHSMEGPEFTADTHIVWLCLCRFEDFVPVLY